MKKISALLLQAKKIVPLKDAEIILAHTIKKSREFIVAHPEFEVKKINKFLSLIKKRSKGQPLAYLLGKKDFFGLSFLVNKHTLIPRPETEIIVEKIIKKFKEKKINDYILIDIGTGSGCIPISIAKNLPNLKIFASDISYKALKIAKKNAKKNNVTINLLKGNLLKPILKNKKLIQNKKLIITANLPYLTPKETRKEQTIKFEPKKALIGGKDGLNLYRKLILQIKKLDKKDINIFWEMNPDQINKCRTIILKIFPNAKIYIHKDLNNKERIIEAKI